MSGSGPSAPADAALRADTAAALASLATALVQGATLSEGLQALVDDLSLRSAAVRSSAGDLIGLAGDTVHALAGPVLEFEVPVLGGAPATLTIAGARPSLLPALRGAASVLGLSLGQSGAAELLDSAENDRDELADALHDGPVQQLVAARFAADLAVRGGDPVTTRDAVQDALVALRRQLWQVRPRGGSGLAAALEQLSAQRVAAGRSALGLVLETDVEGTSAVLAYRVVQAVAAEDGPLRIAVRPEGDVVAIDIDSTAPLLSPERWVQRAQAIGGDLSSSAGRLRLVVPRSNNARTRT